MSTALNTEEKQTGANSYTFPQFVINERTGQLAANLIDSGSGRVLQHIPAVALRQIIQDYLGEPQANRAHGDPSY